MLYNAGCCFRNATPRRTSFASPSQGYLSNENLVLRSEIEGHLHSNSDVCVFFK